MLHPILRCDGMMVAKMGMSSTDSMTQWFQSCLGNLMLEAEQLALDQYLPTIYGYHLVQLGGINRYQYQHCIIRDKILVTDQHAKQDFDGSIITSSFLELPFQEESVDLFVMPHVLEFSKTPLKIINEIYNILIPGGKVIILGFNPISLMGLAKTFRLKNDDFPWSSRFHSVSRIKNWLQNSGLVTLDHKSFCFLPPVQNPKWIKRFNFLETIGSLIWPFWGDVYVLLAKKEAIPVNPIKIKSYRKKLPVPSAYPEPSAFPKVNLFR